MKLAILVLVLVLSIIILLSSVFVLGRRWEAGSIRTQLSETGTAIAQYGDVGKIKIYGYFEEE